MAATITVDGYIAGLGEPLRQVAGETRAIIEAALPGVPGAMWHGHPVWSRGGAPGKDPVCLLKAYSGYVTFGLWRGQAVADPSGRLTAASREMASVKLRGAEDLDEKLFSDWLRQAREL